MIQSGEIQRVAAKILSRNSGRCKDNFQTSYSAFSMTISACHVF